MIDVALRRVGLAIPLVLMATLPGWAAKQTAKQTVDRFNGPWSVVIVTNSGNCDRAYRYGLRIQGGQVHYEGGADVTVSGMVDARGQVTVDVHAGGSSAHGDGQLDDSNGSGTWQGRSSTSQCSGTWDAERVQKPAQ